MTFRSLLLVLSLAFGASSAFGGDKVLLYKSFYGSTAVCVAGGMYTDYTCSDTADGVMTENSIGWLELDVPASVTTSTYQYTSYQLLKHGTYSSDYLGGLNLYNLFASADTVWLVPDPYPSGTSVKATTTNPLADGKVKVVMLWNPWRGETPYIQVGSTWDTMTAMGLNSGLYGWYSETVVGYSDTTSVLFANHGKTQYLNSAGINTLGSLRITLDSVASGSDTIWVRAYPEVSSSGIKATAERQVPKQVMVLNPWDGNLPVQQPQITFGADDDTLRTMYAEAGFCGWYSFPYFERTPSVHFTNKRTAATFGAKGYGDATDMDLSALGDTGWISITPDSLPRLTASATSDRGTCEVTYLAATVRDFATGRATSSSLYNREFGRGKGCWKGGWSVVKGMVDSTLGTSRKPVRSAHDTGEVVRVGWSDSYMYRCTYDTVAGVSHAVGDEIGDSGIATNWFRTVDGKNAETCRDIVLTLDSTNGNYGYSSSNYFPIDDFTTLSSGGTNPYYDQLSGTDGKLHNFGFCLESHGSFEYTKGQVFRFSGDDDVWFFINNRLVVDLGGIHGETKDSILLDTIGRTVTSSWVNNVQVYDTSWNTAARLDEGSTYNFDFFFCERNPQGSNMRIETSMNLRTDAGFLVADSLISAGNTSYTMYVSTTSGQGCQAQTNVARSTGIVRLSGGGFTTPRQLSTGTWFGGIVVDSVAGTVTIDTSLISGLAAGKYTVQFVYLSDTTVVRSYTFTVPYTAGPRFVSTPSYTGLVGSSFAVEVGSYNKTGIDSSSVSFVVVHATGVTLYKDSLLTEPVTDTLRTGVDGIPRRFWVRGDSAGTYVLKLLAYGSADTSDLYDEIVFLDKGLRFVDSTGAALAPVPAILRDVGDTVQVWFEAFAGSSRCTACTDSVTFAGASEGLVFLDPSTRLPLEGGRLVAGFGTVLVTSAVPVVASSIAVRSDTTGQSVAWSPVTFRAWHLVLTDGAGLDLAVDSLDTLILRRVALGLRVEGVDGACTKCTQNLAAFADLPGLVVRDTTGAAVDSLPLRAGSVRFTLEGTREMLDATVGFTGAVVFDTATLTPVYFRVRGPDSAFWYDDDGDGRADRAEVYLALPWTAATTARLSWPDTSSLAFAQGAGFTLSADSLSFVWKPDSPLSGTVATATGLGRWSRDGGTERVFEIADRVPPVPVRAVIRWGSTRDTLRVRPSETLASFPLFSDLLRTIAGGSSAKSVYDSAWVDATTGELVLTFVPEASTEPEPGDSVRFAPQAGIADLFGNLPQEGSLAVVVLGTDRPPRSAVILDDNIDGRADHVRLVFASSLRSTQSFRFQWPDTSGVLESRDVAIGQAVDDSAGVVVSFHLDSAFAFGSTACPVQGCEGLGTLMAVQDGDTVSTAFAVSDGLPPIPRRAVLRYGPEEAGGLDTLVVSLSEPVVATAAGTSSTSWGRASLDSLGSPVPDSGWGLDADLLTLRQRTRVDSVFRPVRGDSLRLTAPPLGILLDAAGNAPAGRAVWAPFEFGPRVASVQWTPWPTVGVADQTANGKSSEASLALYVRDPSDGSWHDLTGAAVELDTVARAGILVRTNVALSGAILLYDHMGTYVAGLDLSALAKAIQEGTLEQADLLDARGNAQVWISWNGRDASGHPVGSGIYLMRLVSTVSGVADSPVLNRVFRLGWRWK